MSDIIPADATIASIAQAHTLNRPLRYVLNVYTHMWSCKKKFGNAFVRVGITGEGKAPHYRIEYSNDRGISIFGVYRGPGHRPFEDLGAFRANDIVLSDDPHEKAAGSQRCGEGGNEEASTGVGCGGSGFLDSRIS